MSKDATIIRLSADALDRLFPEGTEARVQLQHAVLGETAGRFIKGAMNDELRTYLRQIVKDALAELNAAKLIAENFKPFAHWSEQLVVKPDSNIGKAIAESVREAHLNGAYNLARELTAEAVGAIVDMDALKREIDRQVNDGIARDARLEITRRVEAALRAAQPPAR